MTYDDEIENVENAETVSINGNPGHPPSSWRCNKLTDVRRRLIGVIKDIEKGGAEKTSRDAIQYFRLLVYAYQCLASIVKDNDMDEILARLDSLENKGNGK